MHHFNVVIEFIKKYTFRKRDEKKLHFYNNTNVRGGGQFWLVVGFCLIGEQQILKVVFKAKCPECTRMFRIAELSHFFQCCGCLLNRSGSRSMFDRIWSIFKPVQHLTLKQSWIRIEICNIIVKNWKGGSCGFKRLNCVNNFFCGDRVKFLKNAPDPMLQL